jgi:hypothetical protein
MSDAKTKVDELARLKLYFDYLKVDMSIMGVLSAFCVGVAALILKQVLDVKTKGEDTYLVDVWQNGRSCIIAATILMLVASLLFYRQRSRLARTYFDLAYRNLHPDAEKDSMVDETSGWYCFFIDSASRLWFLPDWLCCLFGDCSRSDTFVLRERLVTLAWMKNLPGWVACPESSKGVGSWHNAG